MLRLFSDVAILALRRAARSWLAALSIPIYTFAFVVAARLLLPIPMIGSMALGLVAAAFCAGYLSMLASAVAGQTLRWADLKNGMRAIWDVVSVLFILWIVGLVLEPVARGAGPRGPAILGVVQLAIAIFLNAVPEVLYLGGARSLDAIKRSASFVMEHPVGWFGPNLVLAFIFLWATNTLSFSSLSFSSASLGELLTQLAALASAQGVLGLVVGNPLWKIPLLVLFVHYAMVFRGLLYKELGTGSTRMRDFRRRMGN